MRALPAPVRAALWYSAALSCWGLAAGIIRYAAADLPTVQLGFLRSLFGVLLTVPWLIRARAFPLPRRNFKLYLYRGGLEAVAIAAWFISLGAMLAADVVALSFTTPIFATLLGALLLGERVRLRRGLAIAAGLIGALLVIRPGFGGIGWMAALPVLCSVMAASSRIIGRRLAQTDPVVTIVASLGFITTPVLLPMALAVWQPLSVYGVSLAFLIAGLSLIGHVFIVRGLRLAEASALAPYEFAQLLTAVGFGIVVLGEWPDLWTWVGSAIILCAAIYIVRREAALARHDALVPKPAAPLTPQP